MKKLYDINEEEEFGTASAFDESSSSVHQPPEQLISGLGVDDVGSETATEEDLNSLLKTLNSGVDKAMADDVARQEEEREKYRQEEERRLREAQERYNRERFEREQAEKAERLAREAEEEARALEEEQSKKSGLFSKFKGNKEDKQAKKEQRRLEMEAAKEAKAAAKKAKEEERQAAQDEAVLKAKKELMEKEAILEKKMAEMEAREAALLEAEKDLEAEKEVAKQAEETPVVSKHSFEEFEVPDDILDEEPVEEIFEAPDEVAPEPELVQETAKEEKPVEKARTESKKPSSKKKFAMPSIPSVSTLFAKKEKPLEEKIASVPLTADGEPDWKYIAVHDELTGILNSRAYSEDLKEMPLTFGVVFFDINNLKYVNDNYSHASGNKIIKATANLIQKEFGEEHSYRTGGDEFVVLLPKTSKNTADVIQKKASNIHAELAKIAKEDEEKIPYAVSIGYAIGDGKRSTDDVVKAADASMYRNKKAYKDSHPEFTNRGPAKKAKAPSEPVALDHDELLTSDQKALKGKVKENHRVANVNSTEKIVREIQRRSDEVNAILIASPTFDHLFIIRDVEDFLNIVLEQEAIIDYSYLYVVYNGGPQYYGADEYYTEVTHIFEPIAEGLLSGSFRSEKDIRAIKGINIFKNVFI